MEIRVYIVTIDRFNFITKEKFMTVVNEGDKIVTIGRNVYVQISDSTYSKVTIRDEFIKANPDAFKEI